MRVFSFFFGSPSAHFFFGLQVSQKLLAAIYPATARRLPRSGTANGCLIVRPPLPNNWSIACDRYHGPLRF
jgi:hypothetical protein